MPDFEQGYRITDIFLRGGGSGLKHPVVYRISRVAAFDGQRKIKGTPPHQLRLRG